MAVTEGKIVAIGKTKVVRWIREGVVEIYSKDDLTAGNGTRHDVLEGKGALSNQTTCNVFELLRRNGLPVAYIGKTGPRTFEARQCKMIKLEVVVRGEAAKGSSYLKRNPRATAGPLRENVVEFYLKTSGRRWSWPTGYLQVLPVDDPLLVLDKKEIFSAYDPGLPVEDQKPIFKLEVDDLGLTVEDLITISSMARKTFTLLQRVWRNSGGGRLKDFKLEFGWYEVRRGEGPMIFIADVIDNDSWRLELFGKEVSKEIYRQGADLAEVLRCYQLVAERTLLFGSVVV